MARIELELDAEEIRVLRGALLAARATELASIQRRDKRLFAGYGTDSSREDMSAEMSSTAAGSSSSTGCWRRWSPRTEPVVERP